MYTNIINHRDQSVLTVKVSDQGHGVLIIELQMCWNHASHKYQRSVATISLALHLVFILKILFAGMENDVIAFSPVAYNDNKSLQYLLNKNNIYP